MGQSSNFGLRPVTIRLKLLKSTPMPLPGPSSIWPTAADGSAGKTVSSNASVK